MLFGKPRSTMFYVIVAKLVAIVPVTLLVALMAVHYAGNERKRLEANASQYSYQVAARVDQEFDSMIKMAQVLAATDDVSSGNYNRFYTLAVKMKDDFDVNTTLVRRNGLQIINTYFPWTDQRRLASERSILLGGRVIDSGKPIVTPLITGANSKAFHIGVMVPAPCPEVGGCFLQITVAPEYMNKLLLMDQSDKPYLVSILDAELTVVARSRLPEQFIGQKATKRLREMILSGYKSFDSVTLEGVATNVSTTPVDSTGYYVTVSIPRDVLDAVLANYLRNIFVPISLLLAFSFWFAIFVSFKLSTAVKDLRKFADEIDDGHNGFKTGVKEVNEVAHKFHQTVAEMKAHEDKVNESAKKNGILIRETMHRAKNLLQVIQSMAKQTSAQTGTKQEFVLAFSDRIAALASTQDQLVNSNWDGISISDLIHAQVKVYAYDILTQLDAQGPDFKVAPEVAQNFGLAIHELANNSLKYGALSTNTGKITVRWQEIENGQFKIIWSESGGPAPPENVKSGFGTLVLTRLIAQSFNGTATVDVLPTGLVWTLTGSTSFFQPKELTSSLR